MLISVRYIPGGYVGLSCWPFIFVKKGADHYDQIVNHERIHLAQQKELYFIWFTILYLAYYLKGRFNGLTHDQAYRNIPFEKEAYRNQWRMGYLDSRPRNEWKNYK